MIFLKVAFFLIKLIVNFYFEFNGVVIVVNIKGEYGKL